MKAKQKILKLPYYISALRVLLSDGLSLSDVLRLIAGRKVCVHLKRYNLIISINHLMDLLIAYETFYLDCYRVTGLKEPRLIIDVGAGYGDFSLMVARLYPQCRVIAIDPDKRHVDLLRENAAANNLANIEIHHMAVGTRSEYVFYSGQIKSSGSVLTDDPALLKSVIKANRLDSFFPQQEVNMIKIDCEGAELDILNSIADQKVSNVARYSLEYHNWIVPEEDQQIVDYFNKRSFKTEVLPDAFNPDLGIIYAFRK